MLISVNKAIRDIKLLDGNKVAISGILHLDFEGQCIEDIPENEQAGSAENEDSMRTRSIWTNYELLEEEGIRKEDLKQFDNKQVVVSGFLRGPQQEGGGCGHFSMWPAEIDVIKVSLMDNSKKSKK